MRPEYIIPFVEELHGKKWPKFNSEKICHIAYGRIQVGLAAGRPAGPRGRLGSSPPRAGRRMLPAPLAICTNNPCSSAPPPSLGCRPQGKAALVQHFQNSSLLHEDKRCRPILFHSDGALAGEVEQVRGMGGPAMPAHRQGLCAQSGRKPAAAGRALRGPRPAGA